MTEKEKREAKEAMSFQAKMYLEIFAYFAKETTD